MPSKQDEQIALITARIERTVNRAKVEAINSIAKQIYDKSVDLIAKDMGIARNTITGNDRTRSNSAMRLSLATLSNPKATILATGRRVPLYEMGGRWSRSDSGATFIGRGGIRKTAAHSFIVRAKTGHAGIYKRKGKKRFPLRELFGPSIPSVFRQDRIQKQLTKFIRDNLPREFKRQTKLQLSR